jgi:hypothetical protein
MSAWKTSVPASSSSPGALRAHNAEGHRPIGFGSADCEDPVADLHGFRLGELGRGQLGVAHFEAGDASGGVSPGDPGSDRAAVAELHRHGFGPGDQRVGHGHERPLALDFQHDAGPLSRLTPHPGDVEVILAKRDDLGNLAIAGRHRERDVEAPLARLALSRGPLEDERLVGAAPLPEIGLLSLDLDSYDGGPHGICRRANGLAQRPLAAMGNGSDKSPGNPCEPRKSMLDHLNSSCDRRSIESR